MPEAEEDKEEPPVDRPDVFPLPLPVAWMGIGIGSGTGARTEGPGTGKVEGGVGGLGADAKFDPV